MFGWGKGEHFQEGKKNLHSFQVFLSKLSRRKNFFEVRGKTHQKSVEEKITPQIRGGNLLVFQRRKTYSILQGKKCDCFCEEKKLLEKTVEKNYLGCL